MKALLLLLNDFHNDARVTRAGRLAASMGLETHVFALANSKLPDSEKQGPITVSRFHLRTRRWSKHRVVQLFKYAEAVVKMTAAAFRLRPGFVHANDLNTLPIGFLAARLLRVPLIYDAHELWSETHQMGSFPRWMLRLATSAERALSRRSTKVLTVSEGIAGEMARRFSIPRPVVVRNLPTAVKNRTRQAESPLRQALGLDETTPVLLYQGAISGARGLPLLIEGFDTLKHPDARLVFLGDGGYVAPLQQQAAKSPKAARIHFLPAVPMDVLASWTAGATIGLHPMPGSCLNHILALPNKLFEYVQGGIPVVTSDLPEMKSIIEAYDIGTTFKDGDAQDLATRLDAMLADPARVAALRSRVEIAAADLNWDAESARLRAVYDACLGKGGGA
jgi:glycosyltransferase involved in cell wall biosynthesis